LHGPRGSDLTRRTALDARAIRDGQFSNTEQRKSDGRYSKDS
jgi:hypothetical protein